MRLKFLETIDFPCYTRLVIHLATGFCLLQELISAFTELYIFVCIDFDIELLRLEL